MTLVRWILPILLLTPAACSDTVDDNATTETGAGGPGASGGAVNAGGAVNVGGANVGANNAGGANAGGANAGGANAGGGGNGGAGGAGCAAEANSNACHACCADDHTAGFTTFNAAFNDCGCFGAQGCYGTCSQINSLCGPGGPPIDACTTCAVSALANAGDCANDAPFTNDCINDAACSAYVACFNSCP